MRKLLNLTIILALFVPCWLSAENSEYLEDSYARMSYVKGDVFIQRAEDLGYEQGTVNLALIQGDKIGTREGRTEIHLGEGNYIRIDRDTQIKLAKMPDRSENASGIHLLSGNIFLRINFISEEKFMEVHTPDTSLYILEEGLYYLSIRNASQTEIRVFEGSAEAAGQENSLLLEAEEKLIVSNGRFVTNPTRFYPNMNSSFAEWNSSREAFHNRYAAGTRYLPSELSEYEAELAYYGQWRHHNNYGYVWVPSGISLSWRPYYHGRWVWYPIVGWTWVSYEPWGWCVSHYGRWHWSVSMGWYWIPTRRWGPAWVHWYHGRHHVGWCPLSYYGYPGVVINNHYYGNYYHNDYPSGSSALTVVHKDQLQARNVSKAALSKSSVSRLSKISMSSSQPNIKPAVNKTNRSLSEAAKVFSKTKTRTISKAYSGTRAVKSSPRSVKATVSRSSDMKLGTKTAERKIRNTDTRNIKTNEKGTYQSRVLDNSDLRSTQNKGKRTDIEGTSRISTYPSRKIRNVTRSNNYPSSTTRSSNIGGARKVRSSTSSSSKQNDRIKRYPSRTVSRTSKSGLSSSRNIRSSDRRSLSSSRNRTVSSPSRRSSLRTRKVPNVSSRTKSRSVNTRRISTPNLRTRSAASSRIRSTRSKVRSSSARIRSSSSRSRRSSSRIRSSSSRSRSSSSARSKGATRSRSSSGSGSKKRVRKK